MSDFAVFECTAVLPKENVSKFKTLFYHEGKDRREKISGWLRTGRKKILQII